MSGIENDRLRHIRLHERVNDLPDPNYATLKYFMGHLHKSAHVNCRRYQLRTDEWWIGQDCAM